MAATTEQAAALAAIRASEATLRASLEDPPPPPPPTYTLSAEPPVLDEGQSVAYVLRTEHVAAGTVLPYRLTGIQPADIAVTPLSGTLTIGADGTARLDVTTLADRATEGDETMRCEVDTGADIIVATALIRDTSVAPPPPPPPPPPTGRIEVRGPNVLRKARGEPNNYDNGVSDFIDCSNLPGPVPWSLYLGPDSELCPSRAGVESLGTWQRWHLYGHYNGLYQPLPRLIDGGLPLNYPDAGAFPNSAVFALRDNLRHLRYGARGESIGTPYVTWHGHTRREGSVVHTSPLIPMWIGITLHGHIQYAMRDGSIKLGGVVSVESWANDFTFYEPERKVFFYADTGKGRIMRVDRRTDPWTISTLAEGFRQCDSVRAIGTKLYVADSIAGEVWEVDALTGAKRKVCSLPHAFWVSYFSDGTLAVMTRTRAVYRIDPASGSVGPNLTPGITSGIQQWVTVDVDRAGVMGERDCFIALSVQGSANVDFYRYDQTGKLRLPEHGKGNQGCGPVRYVGDTFGHYPWVGAHHPDEAALLVQGMANAQPQVIVVTPPGRSWVGIDNPDRYAGWLASGRRIALYGDDVSSPLSTRFTTFLPQMNSNGGGIVSADHVALWEPEQIVAFIRAGMLGQQPRPFTKAHVKGWGMRTLMDSERYLREGWPLVQRYMTYCDGLPA